MKSAEEWKQFIDGEYEKLKLAEQFSPERLARFNIDMLRLVQADTLEAAAKRLREEASGLLKEGAAMLAAMSVRHAEEVVRKLKERVQVGERVRS